jgi:Methyltransferase domain
MTPVARAVQVAACPVCGGSPRPLLSLEHQPIYQHPVPADAEVPGPYTVDLGWVACGHCAHAWQSEFDEGLLETIYRSYYYTPAPGGLAVQFRNDFLSALDTFDLMSPREALLEIGASDGDVLAAMKARTGARSAHAFEPNRENAAVARGRGMQVSETFFGEESARALQFRADLVYARHVIEHIFDFADFFAGVNRAATAGADLILETPSLDHHASKGSLAPFHIEHVHVFSLRSLATLARRFGWTLTRHLVTADGNLIAAFRRSGAGERSEVDVAAPKLDRVQIDADAMRARLRQLADARRLVFWGAGSAGIGLVRLMGREPDYWTDGNPNKVGKRFPGLNSVIVSPREALAKAAVRERECLLVIASSFAREILPHVRELGWTGGIIDLDGARLQ